MSRAENNPQLEEVKFYATAFIQLIGERLGISIHAHQVSDLFKTVLEGCQKFECDPHDYLKKLQDSSENSLILEHLITGITVGETYFFRDKKQMNLLQGNILPDIILKKRKNTNLSLNIWSAGCSSGEEIYTITIMLNEILPDIDKWKLNLLGTDINVNALKKAALAIYDQWSMRSTSEYFKTKYFTKNNNFYTLLEKISTVPKFRQLNLNSNGYPSFLNGTYDQDLILCRNVLLYFEENRVKQIMQKLGTCLRPNGYLLLGASDPIDIPNTDLVIHQKGSIYFSKKDSEEL